MLHSPLKTVASVSFCGVLVVVSRFALIGPGPGSMDAALYLNGIAQIRHEGMSSAKEVFNRDTAWGYYVLGTFLDQSQTADPGGLLRRLLGLSALCGAFSVLVCGATARVLGLGSGACLWSIAACALMPRFWALSLVTHPVVPACAFLLVTVFLVARPARGGAPRGARARSAGLDPGR